MKPQHIGKPLASIFGGSFMSEAAMAGEIFSRAIRAREYCAEAPEGVEVWKYAFAFPSRQALEDVHVRLTNPTARAGSAFSNARAAVMWR